MSNILAFPQMERIEEQAGEWIARLDAGDLSRRETEELHDWLRADPRHAEVLMETAELLDRMSVLSSVSRLFPLEEQVPLHPIGRRRPGVGGSLGLVSACAAAAAIVLTSVWALLPAENPVDIGPEYISTAVGELKVTTLADGTEVTLNTNSRARVEFDEGRRRVLLERGEALFHVSHDPDRPFLVEADGSTIRAVGTVFNVEIATAGVEVIVTDGAVEILASGADGPVPPPTAAEAATRTRRATRVDAGHIALVAKSVEALQPLDRAAIDTRLAWTTGELVFEGETLERVVAELGRYTNKRIVIADESIRGIPIGGHFAVGDADDLDDLLDILDNGFGIQATRTDAGVIYLSKPGEPQ